MDYRGASVLITGGLGFIGSNLARTLIHRGARVTLVDNLHPDCGGTPRNIADIGDSVQVIVDDIRNETVLAKLLPSCDVVFNLAAQTSHAGSMTEPFNDLDVNARAQLLLVETSRRVNPRVKIVYASTRQLYGKPKYLPVNEAHPIRPVDVNGVSKLAGEQFHILYNDVYGIRTCVLRLTNIYGPGMRIRDAKQMFMGAWIRRLIERKPLQIFGDGSQLRDFLFVDDCVNAFLVAGASDGANGRVYNAGGSEVVSLMQLAQLLIEVGGPGTFELVPYPPEKKAIDIGSYYTDSTTFRTQFEWSPAVSLMEGLSRTVEYYKIRSQEYLQ